MKAKIEYIINIIALITSSITLGTVAIMNQNISEIMAWVCAIIWCSIALSRLRK